MNPLEARRRLLGRNVYKRTTEGNPAIAQGSLARMYPGIEMQGWTEQDSTTGAQLFDCNLIQDREMAGITFINNGDGSVSISGTATAQAFTVPVIISLPPGTYYVSDNLNSNTTMFYVGTRTVGSNEVWPDIRNGGFTVTESDEVRAYVNVLVGNIVDTTIFPMINAGSTALPWEPYTGGAPSPSPEYPQPITSAGKYNEDTQKWEYEITITNAQTDPDKNQTVTLTADRPLTKWDKLEKRNGQWGWVYKSAEIESYTAEIVPGEYFSTTGQLSTGAQVWYETATETFVPLSSEEQEQMNALHTYRPTTVLSNDGGCEMSLTYKTKKSLEVTT